MMVTMMEIVIVILLTTVEVAVTVLVLAVDTAPTPAPPPVLVLELEELVGLVMVFVGVETLVLDVPLDVLVVPDVCDVITLVFELELELELVMDDVVLVTAFGCTTKVIGTTPAGTPATGLYAMSCCWPTLVVLSPKA